MAIDYNLARQKVNELNRVAIRIVDTLTILERGTLVDTIYNSVTLTAAQISGLKSNVANEGQLLEALAGEIEALVSD